MKNLKRYGMKALAICSMVLLTSCGTKEQAEDTVSSVTKTEQSQAVDYVVAQTTEPMETVETEAVLTLDEEIPLEGLYSDLEFNLNTGSDVVFSDMTLMENSELEIEGKRVSLPCTVKDLEEIGAYFGESWQPYDSDQYALEADGEIGFEDGMIVAGADLYETMSYDMKDGRTIDIFIWVKNTTHDPVKLGDLVPGIIELRMEEINGIFGTADLTKLSQMTLNDLQYDIALNNVKIGTNYKDIIPVLAQKGYDENKANYGKGLETSYYTESEQIIERLACTRFYSDYEVKPAISIEYTYYDGSIFGITYTYYVEE